jgi:lipoyl(octanoyl) transferase
MIIRWLGMVDYLSAYRNMQSFTDSRTQDSEDELWMCEHFPTFTQGLAGKTEHLLARTQIAVIQTNRGGQITYHGPGQIVAYPLIDLQRLGIYVKEYVYRLEESVIQTLLALGVTGHRVRGAPGIYVRTDNPAGHEVLKFQNKSSPSPQAPDFQGLGKIAALGIKVSRQRTYHGVSLNVAMDLQPFQYINPCGYPGLKTLDLSTIGVSVNFQDVAKLLSEKLNIYLSP